MTEPTYPPPPPEPIPEAAPPKGFHGPETHLFTSIRTSLTHLERSLQDPMQRSLKLGLPLALILGATLSLALSFVTQLATGMSASDPVLLAIIAPLTEEPFKLLSMLIVALFVWKTIPTRRHGALLGAAAGVGFAIAESLLYSIQFASLAGQTLQTGQVVPASYVAEIIVARWMGLPFMHVLWSAIVGVGLFALLAQRKAGSHQTPSWLPLPFFIVGLLAHICWNSLAIGLGSVGTDPILSIIINTSIVFLPFAFIFRDFLGGHFNFRDFLTPVSEPLPFPAEPSMEPPPPPPPQI